MRLVVTDTGPILHLHQIGKAGIISHLGEVHATPVVWNELKRHIPSLEDRDVMPWLKICRLSLTASQRAMAWVEAGLLDEGEADALAYAQEVKADMFLTDDTAARTLGESLGLQVRGSLGVVLFAAASRVLNETAAMKILDELEQRSSLWLSTKVKTAARNALALIFAKD